MGGLTEYIQSRDPFDWAANNCIGFVSGALEAQGFAPLPVAWAKGYGSPRAAVRQYGKLLRETGCRDIFDAMDRACSRIWTLHPHDGVIVGRLTTASVMGVLFGVVHRGGGVFLDETGPVRAPLMATDMFWEARG